MKKLSKIIGIAFVAAFAALCLTACGGGSGSAASGSSSAANAYEPIYVVKHATIYSSMIDGDNVIDNWESGWYDYEYDDHGNRTQWTAKSLDPNTKETKTQIQTWSDFDGNGYAGKFVSFDGRESTTEWTIEDAHAVKAVSTSGSTVEFTYYADGKLKSQVTDDGTRKTTIEYDENGRPVHQATEGGDYPQVTESVWTLDDQGRVESMTRTTTMTATGQEHSNVYTYECDENGNISTIYRDGALANKLEYQKIDNPSTYAWIASWIPQF